MGHCNSIDIEVINCKQNQFKSLFILKIFRAVASNLRKLKVFERNACNKEYQNRKLHFPDFFSSLFIFGIFSCFYIFKCSYEKIVWKKTCLKFFPIDFCCTL